MMEPNSNQARLNFEYDRVSVERVCGAILGAAIGDALGWPQERPDLRRDRLTKSTLGQVKAGFQIWRRRGGGRFFTHEEQILEGEYSDDTQLILATSRCLKQGDAWIKCFRRQELPIWLLYERGGGRTTKRAAESWLRGVPPWREDGIQKAAAGAYFGAGGNGAASRILPHALMPGQAEKLMSRQIMLNGILTHGHPKALVGALLYGKAVWLASHTKETLGMGSLIDALIESSDQWGELPRWEHGFDEWFSLANRYTNNGYRNEWDSTVNEALRSLQTCKDGIKRGALAIDAEILREIGCFDRQRNGAGTVAALAAIYLASRYAADPSTGLLEAAFNVGMDTDTVASMVGGLLGALLGLEWIRPEWRGVQDHDYIYGIAESIANLRAAPTSGDDRPLEPWTLKQTASVLNILETGLGDALELGPLGRVKVVATIDHTSLSKSTVAISWKLLSESGQTLYIKKLGRSQRVSESSQKTSVGVSQRRYVTRGEDTASLLRELSRCFPPQVSAPIALAAAAEVIQLLEHEKVRLERTAGLANLRNKEYLLDFVRRNSSGKLSSLDAETLALLTEAVSKYLLGNPHDHN